MSTHASSVRCCKNEESLKPGVVLAWLVRAQKLTCGFSIVLLGSSSTESTPRDCLQDFATLNAQTTRHGARPGPKLAPWCTAGPHACPAAESARKNPRTPEKSVQMFQKKHICTYLQGSPSGSGMFPAGGRKLACRREKLSIAIRRYSQHEGHS